MLRGKVIAGREPDLPNLIWLPDLFEPAENFEKFFTNESNKIRKIRNIHLLNHRNFGSSDHHDSFDMNDLANDIIRYMDDNKITMATIGGHGFGAKVATATATQNLDRFTGVMCLDGGPVNHKYHEAYQDLVEYVDYLAKLDLTRLTVADLHKHIDKAIQDPNWNKIFKQNVNNAKGYPTWDFNIEAVHRNMKKHQPDLAAWSESYGLWPGRAWVMLAAYSRWYHLSTNTLPFYNVFPRLDGKFGTSEFNIFGHDDSPAGHWLHETTDPSELFHISNRMWRWLKFKDGCHVLLADKSEAGWFYLPDRGNDPVSGTTQGEFRPEHVHHNHKYNRKS